MKPSSFRQTLGRIEFAAILLLSGAAAQAAPLSPNSGALTVTGNVTDGSNNGGAFTVQAVLRDGNFSGTATLDLGGKTVSGPLIAKRSYLENGGCHFYFENGRARAQISGKCDDAGLDGRFETFIPDAGGNTGSAKGTLVLSAGAAAQESAGRLPTGKLTCAFNEPKMSFKLGETTQYSLRFSNLGSLTLEPAGAYSAGTQTRGRFVAQAGGKIRLTSGPWAGAVGALENDRSGVPAVIFHIEENRRPDGVHIVDPYTTRCTRPR